MTALDGVGVLEGRVDDSLVALRLLCDRREELVSARTRSVCRLHRLLCELTPVGMKRELSAAKAASVLARIRPRYEVGKIRRALAAQHLVDIRGLDRELKAITAQIADLVDDNGSGLTGLFGVGPVIAGRILAEVGDISRFKTSDRFAGYNGTALIDVSSGEQLRHRLSSSRPPVNLTVRVKDGNVGRHTLESGYPRGHRRSETRPVTISVLLRHNDIEGAADNRLRPVTRQGKGGVVPIPDHALAVDDDQGLDDWRVLSS